MVEPSEYVISCKSPREIVRVMNAVIPQLPREIGDRFLRLQLSYLQRYGIEGLYARVNNRTIATILDECDSGDILRPIESGELDGVRYELFEAPDSKKEDSQHRTDDNA